MINVYIHTIFSSVYKIFSGMDHKLGHKTSLGKFKKTETISSIFSDHNTMRLAIKYRWKKNCKKITNTWRLNNILPN